MVITAASNAKTPTLRYWVTPTKTPARAGTRISPTKRTSSATPRRAIVQVSIICLHTVTWRIRIISQRISSLLLLLRLGLFRGLRVHFLSVFICLFSLTFSSHLLLHNFQDFRTLMLDFDFCIMGGRWMHPARLTTGHDHCNILERPNIQCIYRTYQYSFPNYFLILEY